jgi:hypothetical protein
MMLRVVQAEDQAWSRRGFAPSTPAVLQSTSDHHNQAAATRG